jgi:hypothetical protein
LDLRFGEHRIRLVGGVLVVSGVVRFVEIGGLGSFEGEIATILFWLEWIFQYFCIL